MGAGGGGPKVSVIFSKILAKRRSGEYLQHFRILKNTILEGQRIEGGAGLMSLSPR